MSGPNGPHVQVFHFTSRISSAKIRKYKLATERGMAGGPARDSTPTSGSAQVTPTLSVTQPTLIHPPQAQPSPAQTSLDSSSTQEPPSKRPKLKLSVRPQSQENGQPSQSPDTIAVARPRRDSSMRIRFSENMTVDDDFSDLLTRPSKASPAASSDLSSLSSVPPPEKESKGKAPVRDAPAAPSKSGDYSRDFMSYYVTGGDDEEMEEVVPPPQPKPAPPKLQPPKPTPVMQPPPPPPQETRFKHHVVPPPYPNTAAARAAAQAPRAPPPMPQVHLIDTIKPARGPREPETVSIMVKKLEYLSRTLTDFGGVPSMPKSPTASVQKRPEPVPKTKHQPQAQPAGGQKNAAVDNLMAMFDDDDDDSDEKGDQQTEKQIYDPLNYKLPKTGEADGPLKYGIQFIQNALRSWAYQRVSAQVAQQYQQMQMQARADSQQKRGPGRPRKFDNGDDFPAFTPPPTVQCDLATTPEGAAIIAFQDVLDSGCLQLNSKLPEELSRALRHLYKQIDHLINQGSRQEPQWRCMSYGAQIKAHNLRVEKWKGQHAKAQQEMARQQQLANQQVMQQMGLPTYVPRVPMTPEQAQQAHAIELERRRNIQHAAQQPHLTKYITNPMSLDSTSAPTTSVAKTSGQAGSPVNGTSTQSPSVGPAATQATGSANGAPSSPSDPSNLQLDKIKLYMPNYLPRSGQSMKFSFAPQSEAAIKAFGADAFPNANPATSNIPNRGPMSTAPAQSPKTAMTSSPRPNTNGATPVNGSTAPTPAPQQTSHSDPDTIEVAARPSSRPESRNNGTKPTTNGTNNADTKRPSSSMSASSVNFVSGISFAGSEKGKGKAVDMAARYPHPGAVVLDR